VLKPYFVRREAASKFGEGGLGGDHTSSRGAKTQGVRNKGKKKKKKIVCGEESMKGKNR